MKRAFRSLKDGDRSFLLPFYPSFGKERLRDMVQTLPTPKQTSSLSLSPLFSLPNHPPYSLHPPQNPPLSLPLKVKVKTPPFHFHLFLIWFLFNFCYSNHFACFIHLLICCWEPLYSDLSLIADWCCHDFIDLCLFDWMICWLICSGCWLILL